MKLEDPIKHNSTKNKLLKYFALCLVFNSVLVGQVKFATIGDYGKDGPDLQDVADLIDSLDVDFIITLGDNNYNNGAASTIDKNIGKYFSKYIYAYDGAYPPDVSPDINRFFPSPGNHDNDNTASIAKLQPYLDYFTLPNNERYYDFVWDNVHLFSLNSIIAEPDGYKQPSVQATWLKNKLADCVINHSHWRLVYFHHAPYSSEKQRSQSRWTFAEFGAHAVLAGHSHTYERILRDGIVYFVNGVGGKSIYDCPDDPNDWVEDSQICDDADYGAQLITVLSSTQLKFEFYHKDGTLVDTYILEDTGLPVELISFTAVKQYADVLLEWQTASELNNYGFEVQRQVGSRQAIVGKWELVSFVNGNGNSSSPKFYKYTDTEINNSSVYHYRLKQIDTDGSFTYSHSISVTVDIPEYFSLAQNYPNPFNPFTAIKYSISSVGTYRITPVQLKIYDILGNDIETLVNEEKPAGTYEVKFDGSELTSGMYFYRIQIGNFVETKKMVFMK
jgi:hypothetical protein